MKIAFVLQPIFGVPVNKSISIPLLNHEIARRLSYFYEVIVYAAGNRFQKIVKFDEGVHYYGVPVGADQLPLKLLKAWRRLSGFSHAKRPIFASSLYYWGYVLQVAQDLRKQQCDIVHIHHLSQAIPVIRAFNPGIKIVLHMHMDWLTQIDRTIVEHRLSQVDLVIGCSDYITEGIRRRFPQFAERCNTILNGVDVEKFVEKKDCDEIDDEIGKDVIMRLLFVGRVSPEKGVHTLLDAFTKVVQHYPQVQLEIVGKQAVLPFDELVALSDDIKVKELAAFYPGNYFSNLRDRLPGNVASQVSFVGSIQNTKLINYYQKADIFIFPSIWNEPFGMSNIEAMASGLPVIATRVGGVVNIIEHGKTGLLVERDDPDALAEAILRLLLDKNLRKSLGKAGRQRAVELFTWEKVVEKLSYHYKIILERQEN